MKEEGIDVTEFLELQGLEPGEAYLVFAMQKSLADINLGFFQSWWEGAIAFQNDPGSQDSATKVVDDFAQHTIDRLK